MSSWRRYCDFCLSKPTHRTKVRWQTMLDDDELLVQVYWSWTCEEHARSHEKHGLEVLDGPYGTEKEDLTASG